jgi:hypothetical protein
LVGWVLSVQMNTTDNLWRTILLYICSAACLIAAAATAFYSPSAAMFVLSVSGICVTVILIQNRKVLTTTLSLTLVTAGLIAFITMQYAFCSPPLMKANEKRRPVGEAINALVPADEPLYVFKPGYQAFLFYVRPPVAYCIKHDQITQDIEYLLVHEEAWPVIRNTLKQKNRSWVVLYDFEYRHEGHFYLLRISNDSDALVSSASGIQEVKSFLL